MTRSNVPIKFSVPVHWDLGILETINELRTKAEEKIRRKIYVTMYGALPELSFGSGRIHSSLQTAPIKDAKNYIQRTHRLGFKFRYLLNPKNILTNSTSTDIADTLKRIVEDFEVDGITVAQKEILDLVQEKYSNLRVTVSTIAGVQTPEQIRDYVHYGVVERVCAHHDLNRNIPLLRECIAETRKNEIELELMLTENCVNKCPIRDQHYAVLGRKKDSEERIDDYQIPCWLDKLMHPDEIIGASWITPQGISFYESLGLQEFKITGRDKYPKRLPLMVEAYFNQSFNGNLMRLLGTAPQSATNRIIEAEDIVFLDTTAMDGFYERLDYALMHDISYSRFCEDATLNLWENGSLKLLDGGSKYVVKDGRLTAQNLGEFYYQTLAHIREKKVYKLWKETRNQER